MAGFGMEGMPAQEGDAAPARAFGWYRALPPGGRSTFWGCFGAIAADAMDLRAFSFLLPAIAAAWQLSPGQVGLLGGVSLGTAAAGGWVAGLLGDRLGRVRVMQASLLVCSAATVLSGFTTAYGGLLACRVIQGLGFGGQVTGGAIVMAELAWPGCRGRAVGWAQSGVAVGWAVAALVSAVLLAGLPAGLGWRAVCWLAVVPAGFSFVMHRFVREAGSRQARLRGAPGGLWSGAAGLFRPSARRTTLLASLLALGVQGSGLILLVWLPTYLAGVRHVPVAAAGGYVGVLACGAFCGYIAGGHLADSRGRRQKFLIFVAGSAAALAAYLFAPLGGINVLLLGIPLGFFSQGSYSSLGLFFSELYPACIRGSGTSFAYGVGRLGAAAWVAVVGLAAPAVSLGGAIGIACLCCYALVAAAALLLPETRGRGMP